jgi:hypothetical protein
MTNKPKIYDDGIECDDVFEPKKSKTPVVTTIVILLCVAGAIVWGLTMGVSCDRVNEWQR